MNGNYWDFHNGCWGLETFGQFDSSMGLVSVIESYLIKEGYSCEIKKENYTYE